MKTVRRLALLLFAAALLGPAGAQDAVHVGPGSGTLSPCTGPIILGSVLMNSSSIINGGIAWQNNGIIPPYQGALANYYPQQVASVVQGIRLYMTSDPATPYQPTTFDAYVWSDAGGCAPGNVLGVTIGLNPGTPAAWPQVDCVDYALTPVSVPGSFFIGFWANWPAQQAQWYVATSECLTGTGVTYIAPGTGYPTGWNGVGVVTWGMPVGLPDPNGLCATANAGCLGIGAWNDTLSTAVETVDWGEIKHLFK